MSIKQINMEGIEDIEVPKETLITKLRDKISDRYYKLIGYKINDFIQGCKNLVLWFPEVWNWRNFDHGYLEDFMEKGLREMSRGIGERDFHVDAKQDARNMKIAAELINRVHNEYYGMEYMDYHESELVWIPENKHFRLESKELGRNFSAYFAKYPRIYKQVVVKYKERLAKEDTPEDVEYRIAFFMSRENHARAKRLLYTILHDHMESWWD